MKTEFKKKKFLHGLLFKDEWKPNPQKLVTQW